MSAGVGGGACFYSERYRHGYLLSQVDIKSSKFNYKLKELTGETPGNLFRKFKLNKAARMLHEGQCNVSEVAYIIKIGMHYIQSKKR